MDLQLSGKTAIVTGGSRGIGKAIATVLAAEGVEVGILSRSASALEDAAVEQLYLWAKGRGLGDKNSLATLLLYEEVAGITVGGRGTDAAGPRPASGGDRERGHAPPDR